MHPTKVQRWCSAWTLLLVAALVVCLRSLDANTKANELAWQRRDYRRQLLIAEVGQDAYRHTTTHCKPDVLGAKDACINGSIPAVGNIDYAWGNAAIWYPTDGTPWGIHITGPHPDGETYLLSWHTGDAHVGPPEQLKPPDTSKLTATVTLSTKKGQSAKGFTKVARCWPSLMGHPGPCGVVDMSGSRQAFTGSVITYTRAYTDGSLRSYSYLSPLLSHVLLTGLKPSTRYYYTVSTGPADVTGGSPHGNAKISAEGSFVTLPASVESSLPGFEGMQQLYDTLSSLPSLSSSTTTYPIRVGLLGDVGQTHNSSATRDHVIANKPDIIVYVGDYAYADAYGADHNDVGQGRGIGGTNQRRWDAFMRLWEPLLSSVPTLPCPGNHEIEAWGIKAYLSYNITAFSYPDNYPFQSYAARFPVPGVTGGWGDITQNLYYATVAGPVKVIVLNNYVPFHEGTPQHTWAVKEFESVDRRFTPWLFVVVHAAPYHTYHVHYKEMECFMGVYEDMFYNAGVDFVFSGHVHAYERTHPMYKYQPDSCGPMYVGIGDGGNIEGPYRNFVDEVSPITNTTYCELFASSSVTGPVRMATTNPSGWGPPYQTIVHPPGCKTLTFQPASGVKGGPVLLPLRNDANGKRSGSKHSPPPPSAPAGKGDVGFCQSSQPLWSAHRDPSFGHAMLVLTSDTTATLEWYRNEEGVAKVRDSVRLERLVSCQSRRRMRRRHT